LATLPDGGREVGAPMKRTTRVSWIDVGEVTVVRLVGDHDLSTSPNLIDLMDGVAGRDTPIVVDLTGATFIDSTVLRAIFAGAEDARAFAIAAPLGTAPRRLLELTGLTAVYAVADDLAGALEMAASIVPAV
jgi:anti-sigma B factor antagonist